MNNQSVTDTNKAMKKWLSDFEKLNVQPAPRRTVSLVEGDRVMVAINGRLFTFDPLKVMGRLIEARLLLSRCRSGEATDAEIDAFLWPKEAEDAKPTR